MKRINIVIAVALVIFTGYCVSVLIHKGRAEKIKDLQLQTKTIDLKKLELDSRTLNTKYDEALKAQGTHQEQIKQLEDERTKLQEQLDQAQRELQAKIKAREANADASRIALNTLTGTKTASAQTSGSCDSWIASAGIADVASAKELIRRESGCNPNAINASSGACGVAQELPCGKSGCSLGDGACQIAWMNNYVLVRYKSWAGAIAFHNLNHWY